MQDADWDDLRLVLAVSRTGSFSAAARAMGINETTVSRRLVAAEGRFGVSMFDRAAGRLYPTAAGHDVIRHAEQVEWEYDGVRAHLTRTRLQIAGAVRITAVPLMVNRLLVPALETLMTDHPALRIELVADQEDLSLLGREADLALRFARPSKEARVIARRIADIEYAVYAPTGSDPGDLPWIGYDDRTRSVPQAAWVETVAEMTNSRIVLKADDGETVLRAVEAGLGRSILPRVPCDVIPGLRRLDQGPRNMKRELWLLQHPELRKLARVGRAAAWVTETIQAGIDALAAQRKRPVPVGTGP